MARYVSGPYPPFSPTSRGTTVRPETNWQGSFSGKTWVQTEPWRTVIFTTLGSIQSRSGIRLIYLGRKIVR